MTADGAGPVLLDLRALQSPDFRGRGIDRYARELARALEATRPELVGRFVFDPELPPPAGVEELVETGKAAYLAADDPLPPAARVLHVLSPFELGVPLARLLPRTARDAGLRWVVTVYDLIPLTMAETYLADARQALRYRARLELVRAADAVCAISAAAARELVSLAGVRAERVHVVGTGTAPRFRPPSSRAEALAAARDRLPGLGERFVLCVGGSDGRKNLERLVTAFGALPARAREDVQLVVACELPEPFANHLRHLASRADPPARLLLPGYVPDELLVRLYQSAELFCFPSLAEGYGLPVAEALACGTPVVAADRPPLDELLPPRDRFDPEDTAAITAAIEARLDGAPGAPPGTAPSGGPGSWEQVARRTAEVYESLLVLGPRPRRRRTRLAVVGPLPPVPSGVALHTYHLVAAIARRPGIEVDCFADGLDRCPAVPQPPPGVHDVVDARRFGEHEAIRGYDDVLYVLGNSEFHAFALAGLRRRPGVVLAHDVRLTNCFRFSADHPAAVPGGLEAAIRRAYGDGLPAGLGAHQSLGDADVERYGLLMAREVIGLCRRFLVTSEAAARLARLEAGPPLDARVGVVPFAFTTDGSLPRRTGSRVVPPQDDASPLLCSFGIVDDSKEPGTLIEVVAALAATGRRVRLALVGPVAPALRASLEARAVRLGVGDRFAATGELDPESYSAWLARATLAAQLRRDFHGEASAATVECLLAGVPTVVRDLGWFAELPDDAVARVPRTATSAEVADVVAGLLDDEGRRETLSRAGRRAATALSFDAAADAVLAELLAPRAMGQPGPQPPAAPASGGL